MESRTGGVAAQGEDGAVRRNCVRSSHEEPGKLSKEWRKKFQEKRGMSKNTWEKWNGNEKIRQPCSGVFISVRKSSPGRRKLQRTQQGQA